MFTIIRTIGAVTRSVQTRSNKRFKDLHLDNNLFIYIIRVCEKEGMFLGELADLLHIDRTTSFRSVQKLVKLGYLALAKDPQNNKIKRVYPTDMAKDIYPQLHAYEREQSQNLLHKLEPEERAILEKLMRKLHY